MTLRSLCERLAIELRDSGLRSEVSAVAAQLGHPLQLAVAGGTSAGKSTLVNAVLGRRISVVGGGETTEAPIWFEYGADDGRIDVEFADGRRRTGRLGADDAMPAAILESTRAEDRIRLRLDAPRLRTITLIDTAGLNTTTTTNERVTREILLGNRAAARAQAMVYVLEGASTSDADALTSFRSISADCGITAANCVAVMTRIDRRTAATDPWPDARRLATSNQERLRGLVLEVVPVAGLLAQTARAEQLDHRDVDGLRALAALDPIDLDDLLKVRNQPEAREECRELGVAWPTLTTLVAKLDAFGIRTAVGALRETPGANAQALHTRLATASGFDGTGAGTASVATVLDRFERTAEQHKAFTAMNRLRDLPALAGRSTSAHDREVLRRHLDGVDVNRPVAMALREMRLFAAISAYGQGELALDAGMAAELHRLSRHRQLPDRLGLPPHTPDAELRRALHAAAGRWRAAAIRARSSVARARVEDVLRVLEGLAAGLATDRDAPGTNHPGTDPLAAEAKAPGPHGWVHELVDLPTLPDAQRRVLRALALGAGLRSALAGHEAAPDAAVVTAATEQVRLYRTLSHRPLPPAQRRAAERACAAFESLATGGGAGADGRGGSG